MDQNLEESLSLGSAMGVDFGQSEDVVIQSDINLQHTSNEEIPMDYESTEEQSMLMDTESEEIIVSDFMGDSLSMAEYTLSNEHHNDMATLDPSNHTLTSQSDTIIDFQYEPNATITAIKPERQPKIITVKTVTSIPSNIKRSDTGLLVTAPRQVAIAPKPMPSIGSSKLLSQTPKGYNTMGHIAIAPKPSVMTSKPVTLVANRSGTSSALKKVSIAGASHGNNKGNSVLAQIGKQLIMVPSGAQKIKLVSSNSIGGVQYIASDSNQAQLIPNKNIEVQNKQLLTKLLTIQGQSDVDNQPVVITKVMPEGSSKTSQPRYVTVQQKPVPLSIGNKVLLTTPTTKPISTVAKKHEIIAIHAPNPKIAPAITSGSSNMAENKVLLPTNPTKKVIYKSAPSQNIAQVAKKTNVMVDGQQTQLHQINVPGKGVQYIRLITNPSTSKPVTVKPQPVLSMPSKTFVLTDSKVTKVPQKLVRIAPIAPKTSQAPTQPRPSQSLLAPLSPVETVSVEFISEQKQEITEERVEDIEEVEEMEEMEEVQVQLDSKEAMRELVEETTRACAVEEVSVEQDSIEEVNKSNMSERSDELDQDLIVIPSNYDQLMYQEKYRGHEDRNESLLTVNVEGEAVNSYPSPTPALSETDIVSSELGLRPRKACNCTKSQCLKLYCDCFANGEFCNRCNCNNCHNNLENEELRQKAIRGCLDRNPNAFRPKIGKTKSGGPDIVRRHNKGCNCKRSGCLKNYCECYEAKIACTAMCKCIGCRNVEESLERTMRYDIQHKRYSPRRPPSRPSSPPATPLDKQPCTFMTSEVIDAVCQCLIAVAVDKEEEGQRVEADPMKDVIEEFARCLQDIIGTAHAAYTPLYEGAA